MARDYADFTFEGQVQLGEAVSHFREAAKPQWTPYVTAGMSEEEIEAERGRWTLRQMADIINREFGLHGELVVSRDALHRLERPPIARMEPPLRLIELIANLEIMVNPKTGKPFSDADLIAIAKGLLDWRTGKSVRASKRNLN